MLASCTDPGTHAWSLRDPILDEQVATFGGNAQAEQEMRRLTPIVDERREKMKEEMMGEPGAADHQQASPSTACCVHCQGQCQ